MIMDQQKIAKYIVQKRKEKGYTQKQLGDLINVTNKAVSKWENGGLPDITILPSLANALGITVDELLKGEDHIDQSNQVYTNITINRLFYKDILFYQLYQKKFNVIIYLSLCFILLCGGYAIYTMHSYLSDLYINISYALMIITMILLIVPMIFILIKYIRYKPQTHQYIIDSQGIKYKDQKSENYYYESQYQQFIQLKHGYIIKTQKKYLMINKEDINQEVQSFLGFEKLLFILQIIASIIFVLILCLFLGYYVILRRLSFEWIFPGIEIAMWCYLLLYIILSYLIPKFKQRKTVLISFITDILIIVIGFIIGNTIAPTKTYYSISSNLSSQSVIKQNKQTGQLSDYHYQFLFFARLSNQWDASLTSSMDSVWMTNDCLVTYYNDSNERQQVYVSTFGDRGNGISYYNVIATMSGNWMTYYDNEESYTFSVGDEIVLSDNVSSTVFSYSDIEQNGTIAITLYQYDYPVYVIAIDDNGQIDENNLINNEGYIKLLPIKNIIQSPITMFCTTYKENAQVQEDIDTQNEEAMDQILLKMREIIDIDPNLDLFISDNQFYKVDTNSTDFYEVAFEACKELNDNNNVYDSIQITQITISAGTIQDFYATVDYQLSYGNSIFDHSSNLRIMKASSSYLSYQVSYRYPGDLGLIELDEPLSLDTSDNAFYYYQFE